MQTYIDVLLQLVIKMKVWNNCIKRSFDYRKTTIKNVDSAYIGKLRGGDWEICNNTMIETNGGRSSKKKNGGSTDISKISPPLHGGASSSATVCRDLTVISAEENDNDGEERRRTGGKVWEKID